MTDHFLHLYILAADKKGQVTMRCPKWKQPSPKKQRLWTGGVGCWKWHFLFMYNGEFYGELHDDELEDKQL